VIGAEEHSAMAAAQGEVQEKGYVASFPSLVNISNQPTYIMVLKSQSGIVELYALVNVQNYSIVATGATQTEAMTAYKKLLAQNGIVSGGAPADTKANVTIAEIEKLVINGNSWYYFLGSDGNYYCVSIANDASALFIRKGDAITFTYTETDTAGIRNATEWAKSAPIA
jgi:hypothetical protein